MAVRGYIFIFCAALLWAGIGPVAKFGFQAGALPLETAFWRALLGCLFFLAHCLVTDSWRVRPKDLPMLALFGLSGVSLFFGSYQIAVNESGAALASMLLYTAPAWVALLSRLIFREPMTPLKLLALGVAMAGAGLVSLGSAGGAPGTGIFALEHVSPLGVLCGLLSGLTYALHYIFGKRLLRDYSAATIYLYTLAVGCLGLLPFVTFTAWPPFAGGQGTTVWSVFLFLGFCTTYGAYMCYCAGLTRLEPTRVAVTANLEPVIAALLAYLWWDEYFRPIGYAGGVLVLGGVFLMILDGAKRQRTQGHEQVQPAPASAPGDSSGS